MTLLLRAFLLIYSCFFSYCFMLQIFFHVYFLTPSIQVASKTCSWRAIPFYPFQVLAWIIFSPCSSIIFSVIVLRMLLLFIFLCQRIQSAAISMSWACNISITWYGCRLDDFIVPLQSYSGTTFLSYNLFSPCVLNCLLFWGVILSKIKLLHKSANKLDKSFQSCKSGRAFRVGSDRVWA